ncbi:MAG TPA: ATP-binding protein [Rhodothermales bacterium]
MTPVDDGSQALLPKELPSRAELLEPLVEEAEAFLRQQTDNEELVYRAVLLLSEAATNAMKHGNRLDPTKTVRIEMRHERDRVRIRVCDEGAGFRPESTADPLQDQNLLNTTGRGLFLIREMADEVAFEDDGRCVVITIG